MAEAASTESYVPPGKLQEEQFPLRFVRAVASFTQMAAWPLIARELRGMARQSQIYWIRVIGAALGILVMVLISMRDMYVSGNLGKAIFHTLYQTLNFAILLIGPVITADCIAVEKREGTLGLLFLAPLTSRDIVLAKGVANAIRAFTLLLAVVPLMALPVVLGGFPSWQLMLAMVWLMAALAVALAAGILASTLHREFIQAAVWSVIYCFCFVALLTLLSSLFFPIISFMNRSAVTRPFGILFSQMLIVGIAMMVTILVFRFASRTLKSRWERESQDFKPPLWVRLFSDSELWRTLLKWDSRKARSTHPIAWLQEYSWTARLAKWGWCALALVGELFAVASGLATRGYHTGHLWLAAVIALGIALAGANSFRTERLTGAIELLLVAPLSPAKIIGGRLWGIWVHFFPAVAIVGFCWVTAAPLINARAGDAALLFSSYLFLPMIGLYVSIFPWNVLAAWIGIYFAGAVLPYLAGFLVVQNYPAYQIHFVVAIQAAMGMASLLLIWRKLETRTFVYPNARVV